MGSEPKTCNFGCDKPRVADPDTFKYVKYIGFLYGKRKLWMNFSKLKKVGSGSSFFVQMSDLDKKNL